MTLIVMRLRLWFASLRLNNSAHEINRMVGSRLRARSLPWIIAKVLLLLVFMFLIAFPLYWMLSLSLQTTKQSNGQEGMQLLPTVPNGENHYENAINPPTASPYLTSLLFSLNVTFLSVVLQIIVTLTTGFAFAYFRSKVRNGLWGIYFIILALPEIALLTGQFLVVRSLGLLVNTPGTILALILPFMSSAFDIYLFKNAFSTIPRRIREAAIIDGYSTWRYFLRIALPMVLPQVFTVAILSTISSWNSYMWPSLVYNFAPSSVPQTLPLWLFNTGFIVDAQGNQSFSVAARMAAVVLAAVPMIGAYLILNTRINKAVTRRSGGVKG